MVSVNCEAGAIVVKVPHVVIPEEYIFHFECSAPWKAARVSLDARGMVFQLRLTGLCVLANRRTPYE